MARNRGSSSCTGQLMMIMLIVAGVFVLMTVLGKPQNPQPQARVITPGVVREAIPLNRLQTTTMVIDQMIQGRTEGNALQEWLFRDELLIQVRGEVIAGVDLSKLTEQDIVIEGEHITINLPPSEIFITRIDESKTTVYERDTGLFTNGDPNLEGQARQYAEQGLLPAACQREILQQAALQAQTNITSLVKMFNFTQVTVNAPPGECSY